MVHRENIVPHNISGQPRSCLNLTCSPGHEAIPCEVDDPYSTKCSPCQGNTYMDTYTASSDGMKCKNKRVCSGNKGLTYLRDDPDDHTRDSLCRCWTEHGYQNPEYDSSKPSLIANHCLYCKDIEYRLYPENKKCVECPRSEDLFIDGYGQRHCTERHSTRQTNESITQHPTVVYPSSPTNANRDDGAVDPVAVAVPVAVLVVGVLGIVLFFKLRPRRSNRKKKQVPCANGRSPLDTNNAGVDVEASAMEMIPLVKDSGYTMSENHRNKLEENRKKLTENMNVDVPFLAYLIQNQVITDYQQEQLQLIGHSQDRAAEMIRHLSKCGPDAFFHLVCALHQNSQPFLAMILDSELASRLQNQNVDEKALLDEWKKYCYNDNDN